METCLWCFSFVFRKYIASTQNSKKIELQLTTSQIVDMLSKKKLWSATFWFCLSFDFLIWLYSELLKPTRQVRWTCWINLMDWLQVQAQALRGYVSGWLWQISSLACNQHNAGMLLVGKMALQLISLIHTTCLEFTCSRKQKWTSRVLDEFCVDVPGHLQPLSHVWCLCSKEWMHSSPVEFH